MIYFQHLVSDFCILNIKEYFNDPKILDRLVWANSADPDQAAPRGAVFTICNTVCTFWMHYSMVKPLCLNFRLTTPNILGVRKFRTFTVNGLLKIEP